MEDKQNYIKLSARLRKLLDETILANIGGAIEGGGRYSVYYKVRFILNDYTTDWNCFDIRKEGNKYKVTYWADTEFQETTISGGWAREGRQVMTFEAFAAKYTTQSCKIDSKVEFDTEGILHEIEIDNRGEFISDKVLEARVVKRACEMIVDKAKATDLQLTPKIAQGGDKAIKNVYGTTTKDNRGTLSNSCCRMESDHRVRFYTEFYDNCPCSIVYDVEEIDGNTNLLYRALLWKLDDGTFFMDRPYGTEAVSEALINWAMEQGYRWRSYNSDNNINAQVTLNEEGMKYLLEVGRPYPDTFKKLRGNTLYTVLDDEDADFIFDGTSGEPIKLREICPTCKSRFDELYPSKDDDSVMVCVDCGGVTIKCYGCDTSLTDEDDYRTAENGLVYCNDCYYDRYDSCQNCGTEVDNGDLVECDGDYYCESCAERKGFKECKDCNKWTDESYYVEGADKRVCGSCIEDYSSCEDCGEYNDGDDLNTVIDKYGDDVDVCDSCFSDYERCDNCEKYAKDLHEVYTEDGETTQEVCQYCLDNVYEKCGICEKLLNSSYFEKVNVQGVEEPLNVCHICRKEQFRQCEKCGDWNDWMGCDCEKEAENEARENLKIELRQQIGKIILEEDSADFKALHWELQAMLGLTKWMQENGREPSAFSEEMLFYNEHFDEYSTDMALFISKEIEKAEKQRTLELEEKLKSVDETITKAKRSISKGKARAKKATVKTKRKVQQNKE